MLFTCRIGRKPAVFPSGGATVNRNAATCKLPTQPWDAARAVIAPAKKRQAVRSNILLFSLRRTYDGCMMEDARTDGRTCLLQRVANHEACDIKLPLLPYRRDLRTSLGRAQESRSLARRRRR